MTQPTNPVLNRVLIDMSRSFLQYLAEGSPWVSSQGLTVEAQVMLIAAQQRQDVSDIAGVLNDREHFVDFGTFPTEYTDLQFLALESLFDKVNSSQTSVCQSLSAALSEVISAGDEVAVQLLTAVEARQKEASNALKELQQQLSTAST